MTAASDQLSGLIETLQAEAYQRGHNDAVQRILAAASPATADRPAAPQEPAAPRRRQKRGAAETRAETMNGKARRAARGSIPGIVDRILKEDGEAGLKPAEIVERMGQLSRGPVNTKSLSTHLQRSKGQGRYRNAGGRWFLVDSGGE